MESSNNYLQIVEEIRKDSRISVSELCNGIISERTYYRYLQSHNDIPYHTFIRLIDRLNIEICQLMDYFMYFQKSDSSIARFPYRVHTLNFDDIDIHYNRIKEEVIELLPMRLLVTAYIRKYEYLIETLSKEDYIDSLEHILDDFKDQKEPGIFLCSVQILYLEVNPEQRRFDIYQVAKKMLEFDYHFAIMFYTFSLDTLLQVLMGYPNINIDVFDQLLDRLNFLSTQIPMTFIDMKQQVYLAFQSKRRNDLDSMRNHLFVASSILTYFFGKNIYHNLKKMIETGFDFQLNEFLLDHSKTMIHQRFSIKN